MGTTALLHIHQVARKYGLPAEWLRERALAGELPCLRAGDRLRFNSEAVERALLELASKMPEGADRRELAHA